MIEFVNDLGYVCGINPAHIVQYWTGGTHTTVLLSTGKKIRLCCGEEEWQIAIRETTKTVCVGDHVGPTFGAGRVVWTSPGGV